MAEADKPEIKPEDKPLRGKQAAFVAEYIQCFNAAKAARLAGYSKKTAKEIGCENLTKPNIKKKIKEYLDASAMTAGEVLARLTDQARGLDESYYRAVEVTDADTGALYTELYVDFDKIIEDGKAHLIKKVNYDKDGNIRSLEFYDSQAALVHIGKHHKLFAERVEHTGEGGEPIKHEMLRPKFINVMMPESGDDATANEGE